MGYTACYNDKVWERWGELEEVGMQITGERQGLHTRRWHLRAQVVRGCLLVSPTRNHVGKSVPGRRNSLCKGPEAGVSLMVEEYQGAE